MPRAALRTEPLSCWIGLTLVRTAGDLQEMIAELRLYRTVDDVDCLVEDDLVDSGTICPGENSPREPPSRPEGQVECSFAMAAKSAPASI